MARHSGEISLAVLTRLDADPIVTFEHRHPDGSLGARASFELAELDDLERAIALARRAAGP